MPDRKLSASSVRRRRQPSARQKRRLVRRWAKGPRRVVPGGHGFTMCLP